MQRLNVAVDVADAIDYLHNNCQPPIIHCDSKPSNVLLDQDLVAHVGDLYSFGIVMFTGMAPTDGEFRDGLTLQKHAENSFSRMLIEIVDPALLTIEEAYTEDVQGGRNQMEDINQVKLALSSSKQAPSERMCMRDAAADMHRIRDHYAKRSQLEEVTVK
jgi:hypothetical protein